MKNKAFTVVEVLIAVTLMTVVITAVCGLILSTMLSNQRNIHELQGMYFAEESLEAVRFMRDSNWLQNYSWDGGDVLWGGNFSIDDSDDDSDSTKTFYLEKKECFATHPCFGLSKNASDGTFESAEGLSFLRELFFKSVPDSSAVQVTAKVSWVERGVNRSVSLSTYLSNWK